MTTVVALLAVTGGLPRSPSDLAKLGRADFGVFQSGLADLTASSLPDSIVPRIATLPGVAATSPIQIVPKCDLGQLLDRAVRCQARQLPRQALGARLRA